MFRHLLVPLDGSPLAEVAVPVARQLAETFAAKVTLLHLIERHPPAAIHGQPHLATVDEAERYLGALAETLPAAVPVERHVHRDEIHDVARSIVNHAEELQIDLVVLCTHGAGGVRHGLFGTVAERAIALGRTPVLLVPARPQANVRHLSCHRLLVPMNGEAGHEQGLSVVVNLAAEGPLQVLLLMVVPTWRNLDQSQRITARTLPGTTAEMLDAASDPAQAYLDEKAAGLRSAACDVTTRIVRGDPVAEIVSAARDFDADLIVLATHGTTHLEAFWSESVTPQLARKSQIPLLLVPLHGDPSKPPIARR
jgi:nucleotide-binding universal stress UspA family protein